MTEKILPHNVGDILDRCIYSVSQLEILLLLRRYSERAWTAQQVATELHTNEHAARQMLRELLSDRLIKRLAAEPGEEFAYDAGSDNDADVQALACAYEETRMRVVDRIFKKPRSRNSVRQLSDSIRMRREDA